MNGKMESRIALSHGEKFAGYTVEKLLGKGGMGVVYLVRSSDGMQYALKLLNPDNGDAHNFRKRFAREAEVAMKIRHKNLIPVHAAGEDPNTGLCYIVMDLISRTALKQILTEIGLTGISDLLNMTSSQKTKMGQLEGIKYIIVPSLRKLGSRITMALKTVETSTGDADQERCATLKCSPLDEIADKLEATLRNMLGDKK